MRRASLIGMLTISTLIYTAGCDAVVPDDRGDLVIQAYVDAAQPLPPVRVTRTQGLSVSLSSTQDDNVDTHVLLSVDGIQYPYDRHPSEASLFVPRFRDQKVIVEPGAHFELDVESEFESAILSGQVPPVLTLKDINVLVAERPISAVFVDTLDIGLDSLNLGLNATTGFIYPVQVSIQWNATEFDGWIETRLDPLTSFSSSLIDFFLLPSQVFQEDTAALNSDGNRVWNGVYAIPVESENDPVPEHSLNITLLRGDERFARFATSRDNPARREPVSSLTGVLGFVGGVSIDSLRVTVGN